MKNWNERTELLLGPKNLEKLAHAHVCVCGLGGVGAAAAELIARAGVGEMTLVDGDTVDPSNRNRQLGALLSTEGMAKTAVWEARLRDINPGIRLRAVCQFMNGERFGALLAASAFDYVVDAIDTLSPKVELIARCLAAGQPLVSSMGAGGKLDPDQVFICRLRHTYGCTLARAVRKRLRSRGAEGLDDLKVIFSPEAINPERVQEKEGLQNKKSVIGTISYLPPIFGAFAASVVIRDLLGEPLRLVSERKMRKWQEDLPASQVKGNAPEVR
jgi:tRNA A37 threonylcarbamoyladenosine dehydratase